MCVCVRVYVCVILHLIKLKTGEDFCACLLASFLRDHRNERKLCKFYTQTLFATKKGGGGGGLSLRRKILNFHLKKKRMENTFQKTALMAIRKENLQLKALKRVLIEF